MKTEFTSVHSLWQGTTACYLSLHVKKQLIKEAQEQRNSLVLYEINVEINVTMSYLPWLLVPTSALWDEINVEITQVQIIIFINEGNSLQFH